MTAKTLRSIADLASAQLVTAEQAGTLQPVATKYAIAIPAAIADMIDRGRRNDPIALQYVPDVRELVTNRSENGDPIGDRQHTPVEGIVHRYRDRVLLKVVHVCPVYCRFCFRREMVGPGHEPNLTPQALERALAYIRERGEIAEVILTGGDPFMLASHRVAALTQALAGIPHVQRIRWHTRIPVVEPHRVTAEFVAALKSPKAKTCVALHANHQSEFTPQARRTIALLVDAGVPMLSQSVLLKSVNDDVEVLSDLMRAFVANRIRPYYLHHGDLAPGTSHFRTTISQGKALLGLLRARASGLALPAYVLDIPGGFSKVNLESEAAVEVAQGHWRLCDDNGKWHDYFEDASLFG
ncbi:MAG: lysine-2,3-aminomutase-like protein [Micropepsaceae bacterium]